MNQRYCLVHTCKSPCRWASSFSRWEPFVPWYHLRSGRRLKLIPCRLDTWNKQVKRISWKMGRKPAINFYGKLYLHVLSLSNSRKERTTRTQIFRQPITPKYEHKKIKYIFKKNRNSNLNSILQRPDTGQQKQEAGPNQIFNIFETLWLQRGKPRRRPRRSEFSFGKHFNSQSKGTHARTFVYSLRQSVKRAFPFMAFPYAWQLRDF